MTAPMPQTLVAVDAKAFKLPVAALPPEVMQRWQAFLKEEIGRGQRSLDALVEQMLLRLFAAESATFMRAISHLVDGQKNVRSELARVERADPAYAGPGDSLAQPFAAKTIDLRAALDDPGGVAVTVAIGAAPKPLTTYSELSGYRHEMLQHLGAIQLALSHHKRAILALQMEQARKRDELLPALQQSGALALATAPRISAAALHATLPGPLPQSSGPAPTPEKVAAVQAVVSSLVTLMLQVWKQTGQMRRPDWRAACVRLLSWMVGVLQPRKPG